MTSASEVEQLQANLDPSSCRTSQEKRHARSSVWTVGRMSLSKSYTEIINDKEQTMPTSKSDLEAKEGQVPNELTPGICLLVRID